MAPTLAPPVASDTRRPLMRPEACGAVASVAVGGLYWIGAGRPYGFDASISVHGFIATGSLLDPFRKQFAYNNHVLFSFLEHIVYSTTGSADEHVLRVLPVVAVALAVGVIAAAVARRWGWLAGLTAAAVVAANPVLSSNARDVRGYGLLLLACVVSTVLLFTLRGATSGRPTIVAAYVLALAAGIATHLFGLAMLPLHASVVGADQAASRRWLGRWTAAAALGLLPYVAIASATVDAVDASLVPALIGLATAAGLVLLGRRLHLLSRLAAPVRAMLQRRTSNRRVTALAGLVVLAILAAAILQGGSGFDVGSPIHVVTALLGSYRLVAVALLFPAAAGLLLIYREHPWSRYATAVAAATVVTVWLLAPHYLAPRFFIWLLPAAGCVVAVAVARWRALALVVLAVVAAEVYKTAPDYAVGEVANRQAAQIAVHVAGAGGTACAFAPSASAIQVYDPAINVVQPWGSPSRCDALLIVAPWLDPSPPRWFAALPHAHRLPAHVPGLVRWRAVAPDGQVRTNR